MKRRRRSAAALALWLLGIGLLGWGLWPARRVVRVVSIDLGSLSGPGAPTAAVEPSLGTSAIRDGTVVLEYPQSLRSGDLEFVRLTIQSANPGPAGAASEAPVAVPEGSPRTSLVTTGQALAMQARLDLDGATVKPEGDITSPLSANAATTFVWTVRAADAMTVRGTAWAFLISIRSPELAGERLALSAQTLQFDTQALLGMSGPAARILGAALTVLGSVLGMPLVDRLLRKASLTRPEKSR